jgi:hypothetical protein
VIAFVAVGLALCAAVLAAVLGATHGQFSFSLDDPYIHLALAQKLQMGHYGLNSAEYSAPASSILYPILLAALLALGVGGQWAALGINLVATAISTGLLAVLAEDGGVGLARVNPVRLLIVAAAAVLGLNLVGLAFTGLEHALHVADTLACLLGVVRLARREKAPVRLGLALVLNPLIRFEGLAIWGAGLLVLLLDGRRRTAGIVFAAGVILVGGFCLYLHHLGLAWLPSSVLAKSPTAGAQGLPAVLAILSSGLLHNLGRYGAQFAPILALLAVAAGRGGGGDRRVAIFAGLPILAQLAIGPFGWFGRYEIYALALGWAAVLVLYGPVIARWLDGGWGAFAAGVALWITAQFGYVKYALLTPAAASEIHLQQYQMHRFVAEVWRRPVAVNDIGWVAYGNPNYVLDLAGLGSETARLARVRGGEDPAWMDRLARSHQVGIAMVYPDWFKRLPQDWTPVATLAGDPNHARATGENRVTFYATRPEEIPAARKAVADFAGKLPAGAVLTPVD